MKTMQPKKAEILVVMPERIDPDTTEFYSLEGLEECQNDDEISSAEEGFMFGYLESQLQPSFLPPTPLGVFFFFLTKGLVEKFSLNASGSAKFGLDVLFRQLTFPVWDIPLVSKHVHFKEPHNSGTTYNFSTKLN